MDLEILSLGEVIHYLPKRNTYAIRIDDDNRTNEMHPLRTSDKWIGGESYCFERFLNGNAKSGFLNTEFFDYKIAERILYDFVEKGARAEGVMVHSHLGISRAPAIGKAMNDIYGWGVKGLEEEFAHYDKEIYRIMMEVGKSLG